MIPSSKWFPTSLQERAAWYNNFATQFAVVYVSLGFKPTDNTEIAQDNATMQFLAQTAIALDAFKEAIRQYRVIITEGNLGDPTPVFPANTTFEQPLPASQTGIFERLDDFVKRARVSPGYTSEIGALLGILPSTPPSLAPADMQPSLKTVSLPGSIVQVSFVRGNTNGLAIETKIDNSDTWSDAGKFFNSPAELKIPVNAQNLPRSVQVRARYVEKNTPIGQFSDIVTTATQPAS